ncbi:Glioma tumor suppressor candidate region 2 protein [Tupaia chinensis]|uniref:Methylosome subunit pICln n=1 Tax=Tupaia chinensis TaxID=246437 RepID=L9L8Q9_TUPCH|nr:Glioma tumor suppressor candidate region 2 protein [Tupaia chinensis]
MAASRPLCRSGPFTKVSVTGSASRERRGDVRAQAPNRISGPRRLKPSFKQDGGGKRGWRRLAQEPLGLEVDQFLEDVRLQERTTGGLLSEAPDEKLFFVDTGSKEKELNKKRTKVQKKSLLLKKPLRVDLVLENTSKIPRPQSVLAHQVPNAKKLRRKEQLWEKLAKQGELPREVRKAQARLLNPPTAKARPGPQDTAERPFYDLWDVDNPLDRPLVGQDAFFLEQTKKKGVKRPSRLHVKPSQAPAVEVTPAGASYNPTFEDHQSLLLAAHEVELQRQREAEKLERQESVFREMWRKTEQQRRREKAARMLRAQQAKLRAARLQHQELFRLRGIKMQVAQRLAELARRQRQRQAWRLAEADKPRRLGRLKYQAPDIDVQLSSELSGSLRTLKPEGNILRDRFKSFQRRNMIEPRERAKFKRKYKVKLVEKRSFRLQTQTRLPCGSSSLLCHHWEVHKAVILRCVEDCCRCEPGLNHACGLALYVLPSTEGPVIAVVRVVAREGRLLGLVFLSRNHYVVLWFACGVMEAVCPGAGLQLRSVPTRILKYKKKGHYSPWLAEGLRQQQAVLAGKVLGTGTLHIAESRLSWLDGSGLGFSLEYPTISLHAVSRDLNADLREHLYVMVNARFGEESKESVDEEEEEDSDDDAEAITEFRFVPSDKSVPCLRLLVPRAVTQRVSVVSLGLQQCVGNSPQKTEVPRRGHFPLKHSSPYATLGLVAGGQTAGEGRNSVWLKKKLEDEFPGCLDICGEGTPQTTGFFEVMVAGKLVHSKKRGDGFVDTESKFLKLVAAIKTALAQG